MSGRLEERLPTIGGGEEFRRLSASLNAMLDRIEALMGNLRQVSTDIAHDLRTPLTRLRSTLEGIPAGASAAELPRSMRPERSSVRVLRRGWRIWKRSG